MIFNGAVEEKWGLCLAGGGGKGAYEIGVWKALEECTSIKFHAVSGTSVGALNAALFATMKVSEAEAIWKEIRPNALLEPRREVVLELIKMATLKLLIIKTKPVFTMAVNVKNIVSDKKHFTIFYPNILKQVMDEGFFSREGLEKIIASSGIQEKLSESEIECFAAVCNVRKSCAEYFLLNNMQKDEIRDILIASSALPLVYGKKDINGVIYRDGGLINNIPIEPLYGCGCTHVIVVHLESIYKKPGIRKAKRAIFTDEKNRFRYKDMSLYHVYPKSDLKGLCGTLNFSPKNISKLIVQGYEETKEYFS